MTVKGLAKIERKLAQMEPKLRRKILNTAIKRAAQPVLESAKSHVPIDSGDLHDSLRIGVTKSRKDKHIVMARVYSSRRIAANEEGRPYAVYVEFGTSTQPGDPFMRLAVDERSPEVAKALGQEIKRRFEEVV